MKIAFTPYYSENPYQPALINELNMQGCEVSTESEPNLAWARSLDDTDIVHLHWLPRFKTGLRGRFQLRRYLQILETAVSRGVKIVWTVHNLIPHGSVSPKVDTQAFEKVAKLASRLIAHSDASREAIVEFYNVPKEKVAVIPHGNYIGLYPNNVSKSEARLCLGLPEDSICFAFVGLIRPYKGVLEMLDAFIAAPEVNAKLLIAGKPTGGISREELQTKCKSDDRIILNANRIPHEDMQLYLNACDAALFPYRRSLTSGAIILAMSFGKACIAYRNEGSEAVLDNDGAIFVEKSDHQAFIRALERATRHPRFFSPAGSHNLLTSKKWNWSDIATRTLGIYKDATASEVVKLV